MNAADERSAGAPDPVAVRAALVDDLVGRFGLAEVAARACAGAGIAGMEQQLAYCLIVLCQKADPVRRRADGERRRTYDLDLDDPDFAAKLRSWAQTVAAHLGDWAPTYRAVFDEGALSRLATFRTLIPSRGRHDARGWDDVVDEITSALAERLLSCQPLDAMSIATARAEEPDPGEYVFQTPLRQWVRTAFNRRLPRSTVPLDDMPGGHVEDPGPEAGDGPCAAARDDVIEALGAYVAGLGGTRALLADVVAGARDVERRAAAMRLRDNESDLVLKRFRRELLNVIRALEGELQAFDELLAYVAFALRCSPNRQHVAIVSMRAMHLDAEVVAQISRRLRVVVDDDEHPGAALAIKAHQAIGIPANRPRELDRVRTDAAYRRDVRVLLARMLDALPATVRSFADIGTCASPPIAAASVKATRNQVLTELRAVDADCARVYDRYARWPR